MTALVDAAPLSAMFLGFLLGLQHATDPDHLVAVATILTRQRRFIDGAMVGVLWGAGHMTTLTIVFSHLFKITIQHYAIFLFAGMMPWNFLSGSLNDCAFSIIQNEGLIRGSDLAGWRAAWHKGLEGVQARGKAEPGDKTMVDALIPAIEALDGADDLESGLRSATQAAEEGMRATTPLVARKGRASYLGERSVGHQDPGATSSALLVRTLAQSVG